MKKVFVLLSLLSAFIINGNSEKLIKPACADGPYCASTSFKCRNYNDDGFVCCNRDDGSRCCHYRGSGDAYCAYSCD